MAALWTDEHKLAVWTEVEALVLDGWARAGVVPGTAGKAVRAAGPPDVEVWKAREAETGHDVAAFVDTLADRMETDASWLHYGLTSSDVLDTALGHVLGEAGKLLIEDVRSLLGSVKRVALEHRDTLMVGRTHGIWAEPTTFGLKLATWAFELDRDRARLERAVSGAAIGKISGAVGTYAHIAPDIELAVCDALGIGIEPASSQIVHRDRHAELLSAIALTGSSLERFATELRHLQRSEVAEVAESFGPGQKGSSAMPHKRNPIGAENITGIARLLRAYAGAGMENIALWHERDISHSSVERVVLPDACLALDFALHRMKGLVDRLVVDRTRMLANLAAAGDALYSQAVLLALVRHQGLSRDSAYRLVQAATASSRETGTDLRSILESNEAVELTAPQLDACFDPGSHLRNAGVVFDRLETLAV